MQPELRTMSYVQTHYHIVIVTKYRAKTISHEHCDELYKYIWGIIKAKNCVLYQINGIEDHIHIFTSIHQSIALADFVKGIKVASSIWLKANPNFPRFNGWGIKYAAFTHSILDKPRLVGYIKKQKRHHGRINVLDEYKLLLIEHEIPFEEKYLP